MKWFGLFAFGLLTVDTAVYAQKPVSFNRDIRPIMADTCFRCHGPDKGSRMANLRLDLREEATKANRAGRTPVAPGDPEHSLILERIFASDAKKLMPPPYAHKELTQKQKETIRRWVVEGAKYEGHWAYQPIERPEVPQPQSSSVRNPIDALVQAKLAEQGLRPAAEADRRTLLRRVSLDLTGLPPSPKLLQSFLADQRPDAYERIVDQLLASPAYAEKMAMHWLDAVRYADTAGFHGDNIFPAWPYRDYVLRAFRDNKPFDQFTREQLAGDLLPGATDEQRVASAFNRLNRMSAEGGLQPKEYLAKYGADRVRTVAAVWMGATIGCAECHDHKFDPLLAKDFYSLKAFFADIKETGLVPDRGSKAWGSLLSLPSPEQKTQLQGIVARVEELRRQLQPATNWEADTLRAFEAGELDWKTMRPLDARSVNGATLKIYNEEEVDSMPYFGGIIRSFRAPGRGLVVASGANPDNETYTVTLQPEPGTWRSFGLEVVQDESLLSNAVARGGDRLAISEIEAKLMEPDGKQRPLRFLFAQSNVRDTAWEQPPMAAIDGKPDTAWGVLMYGENKSPFLALRLEEPIETKAGTRIVVTIRHDSAYRKATLGRFRVALAKSAFAWPEASDMKEDRNRRGGLLQGPGGLPEDVLEALRTEAEKRKDAGKAALERQARWMNPANARLYAELGRLEQQRYDLQQRIPQVVVSESTTPAETRLLRRGNFLDESGPVVEPAMPEVFGKLATTGRATRLDLANWLVGKDNPLTARVVVNRQWRLFFGTGLSRVLDDLGSQGELPANLELIDWLAAEFRSDWDLKRLNRLIVTSHTYRQSSVPSPEALAQDPDNRLLARQSRFRVDAEVVHDIAMAASGLLTTRFGGPSVRPYQPEGYLAALNFPKRDYSASRGADQYARAVYTQWQRTFLHPSLMTFDAPSREECTVNRVNSNTPLQALVLLNDPIYVEAARVFAQNMLAEGGPTLAARIDWAFIRALSRPATSEEKQVLTELYEQNRKRFLAAPIEAKQFLTVGDSPLPARVNPAELGAATMVTRAILNLHETITRN